MKTISAHRFKKHVNLLFPYSKENASSAEFLAWILLTTLFVASLLTWQYWDRSKEIVQNSMSETGNVLLIAIERAMNSGRHTSFGVTPSLQYILEELMLRDAVQFFAVTTANGMILFHSNPSRVGKHLSDMSEHWIIPQKLEQKVKRGSARKSAVTIPHWRIMDIEGHSSFVVYRRVTQRPQLREAPGVGASYLFLGMDPTPLNHAYDADKKRALSYGGSVLLFGMTLAICVYAIQRLLASRRRQREAEALVDELALTLPDGLLLLDVKGRVIGMNDAAFHMLHPEEVSFEKKGDEKLGESLPQPLVTHLEELRHNGLLPDSEIQLQQAGHITYLSIRGGQVGGSQGEQIGFLVLLRDISEVRRLEAEVRRREKLAAVGNLAAGVAHELRNPLSSIKGYATYFSERFPADSDEREAAKIMVRETDRLNRTITELLGLARPTDIHVRPSSLLEIVRDVIKLIRQDADARGIVIALHDCEIPLLPLDSDRIRQVLLNLCINALDAMPHGGSLTLALHPNPSAPDKQIELEIQDTGEGIAPENLTHIFDPYFTTKGHGTGLGLATVHKIMEAHGGSVSVSSAVGKGTCFRLFFPFMSDHHQNL